MAYFGPANKAKDYFIHMGYTPANRQTTPDFLVAVTDPNGRIQRPGAVGVPRTASEFAEYFRNSDAGRLNEEDIKAYRAEYVGRPNRVSAYQESAWEEHAKTTNKMSPYTISIPMQARAVMVRRVGLTRFFFFDPVLKWTGNFRCRSFWGIGWRLC
jgi:ATP-binding cassette subfamily G (WHITE) protein 2 (SNQ2)